MTTIEQLQPGMVVKYDVKDAQGRLLLGSGAILDERHIGMFRNWGVTGVEIRQGQADECDEPGPAELDPELLEKAEAMTRERFRCANTDHPAMRELFRLAVERQARRLTGGC